MKNLFKIFGLIAITAIIGLSMTACDSGSDDSLNIPGLKSAPSAAELLAVGISQEQFDAIRNAVPGFQGVIAGSLKLFWIGGNETVFYTLLHEVEKQLEIVLDDYTHGGEIVYNGNYGDDDKWFVYVVLFAEDYVDPNGLYTIPKNTIELGLELD